MACEIDHAKEMMDVELKLIEDLPESQKGTTRHRCACCAFLAGYQRGLKAGEEKALNDLISAEDAKKTG